jgi:hypothetical protein
MLNELDETIRQILINEGRLDPAEVDVSFDIPNREWSSGISKPTLNCYLFDIHERRVLREDGWRLEERGTPRTARRQPPLFYEMTYLVTAWTRAVEDEHRLLWQVLRTLVRFPVLNDERTTHLRPYLQGDLQDYPWPIAASVAQMEGVLKSPGEFWTALENQIKPSLSYVVTLGLDREAVVAGPPVLSTGISIRLPESTSEQGFQINRIFQIKPNTTLEGISVTVAGHTVAAVTDSAGHFQLEGLPPGRYTLLARIGDQMQRRVVLLRDPAGEGNVPHFSDVIRDQTGAPLSGVLVEIVERNLRALTDAEGRFTFDLAPGRYTLTIHCDGWTQRRQISVRNPSYMLTLGYGGRSPGESEPAAPTQDTTE